MPEKGAELADELEELVALHDASNIAAVIVEPFAGSAGVLPPPKGYLQRLRAICDKHQILLIFDEVITGFGRAGARSGAEAFGVMPDIMNFAKQLTNGAVPMGAVVVKQEIYQTFMSTGGPEYMLEFPHGYTYSGPSDRVCGRHRGARPAAERQTDRARADACRRISRAAYTRSKAANTSSISATTALPAR